jgi:hypothetical protein
VVGAVILLLSRFSVVSDRVTGWRELSDIGAEADPYGAICVYVPSVRKRQWSGDLDRSNAIPDRRPDHRR